jgi:Holliday junction resolvase RusA-like endonuclease
VLTAYLARPLSHFVGGKESKGLKSTAPDIPAKMPDIDKIARAALDALTVAKVLADDKYVSALTAYRRFVPETGVAGLRIMLEEDSMLVSPAKHAPRARSRSPRP